MDEGKEYAEAAVKTEAESRQQEFERMIAENAVTLSAGDYHSVCLYSDGTVLALENNNLGQCDVEDWTDIRVPERPKI